MVSAMQLYHDSRDPHCRAPAGAQKCGTRVMLCLYVRDCVPDSVHLRLWFGKESFHPMEQDPRDASRYRAVITLPETPCLLWYDFQVWSGGQFYWYGNAEDRLGGMGALVYGEARSFQITVYDPAFAVPGWTRGAVFYQIFPDRFARGQAGARLPLPEGRTYHASFTDTPDLVLTPGSGDNYAHDFFGGTLRGIMEKLPYLASLGITGLYLNPIFRAGTNHRFDTIDWMQVDPALGTEEDFHALCEAAKGYGIHIILDGVFSHAGNKSPFFLSAQTAPDSPYRNWFGFEHWPDMYKSWWGFRTLPELDKRQPGVIAYFLGNEDAVVKHWVRGGASGWRLDVADELPMEYLRMLRPSVREEKADALIIGEVWEDASNKVSYGQMRSYCLGDTLDGVMNYPLREAAIDFLLGRVPAGTFKRRMDSLYENYPQPFQQALLNVIGTHDRPRILNILAGADGEDLPREKRAALRLTKKQRALGEKRLRLMFMLVFAMPGMPCVYYGDEAGMEGAADPFNRAPFPWGREDRALTAFFADAIARRKALAPLSGGSLSIEAPREDVLAILREEDGATVTTFINRGARSCRVSAAGHTLTLPAFGFALIESQQPAKPTSS